MATAAGQAQHFTPVTLLLGHTDQLAPVVGTEFGVITLPSRVGDEKSQVCRCCRGLHGEMFTNLAVSVKLLNHTHTVSSNTPYK